MKPSFFLKPTKFVTFSRLIGWTYEKARSLEKRDTRPNDPNFLLRVVFWHFSYGTIRSIHLLSMSWSRRQIGARERRGFQLEASVAFRRFFVDSSPVGYWNFYWRIVCWTERTRGLLFFRDTSLCNWKFRSIWNKKRSLQVSAQGGFV